MQAAMMTYCLKNALPDGQQTLESIVRLAGKEEIRNLEVYGGRWEFEGDRRKAAESLRKVADEAGVALPVYGSGTRLGHVGPEREPCMKRLKEEAEACAVLGAGVLTYPVVDGQPVPPDQPDAVVGIRFERMLPILVEQVQELADHAAKHGVEIAVLNHCFLVYLGWHQKWMARLADRANSGACVDPGNYLHYASQDPVSVCKELGSMAKMVRAGDVEPIPEDEVISKFKETGQFGLWRGTTFGNGVIDQEACYRNLAQGGYNGFVSLKTAGASPEGPLAAIRESWRALNELLERVG